MVFATPGHTPDHIKSSEEEASLFSLQSQAKFTLHLLNWLLQAPIIEQISVAKRIMKCFLLVLAHSGTHR